MNTLDNVNGQDRPEKRRFGLVPEVRQTLDKAAAKGWQSLGHWIIAGWLEENGYWPKAKSKCNGAGRQ
jgi:hypothetical protein